MTLRRDPEYVVSQAKKLLHEALVEGLPFVLVVATGEDTGKFISSEDEEGTAILLTAGLNELGGVQ